ncbi:LuxR C-terminal-related transcriptional regulator [Micromonospora auratinigra]|uniref:LuxR C-terminal-related transcriptional regulator n=1 Tax=Micromonospora auratinigra TaxID=261654 RepID=UPI00142FFB06|nr:response regulator transcription factor [Micromonospora auratinigra]
MRVLVVDDIRLFRDHVLDILGAQPFVERAAGAADAEAALRAVAEHGFRVVLVSLATRDSLAVCRRLVAACADTRVIALGVSGGDDEVVACAEAGVTGYLLRDESSEGLLRVVAAAGRGEVTCPPPVAAALMRRMGQRGRAPGGPAGESRLTTREREILGLIDEGMSNKEIARKLNIEIRTVKNHVHNLLEKLEVSRRGEAAALVRGVRRRAQAPGW